MWVLSFVDGWMDVVFTVARLIKPVIICEVLKNEWALQAKNV
jgi:hypothetical protein